jgi:hypothetical protein
MTVMPPHGCAAELPLLKTSVAGAVVDYFSNRTLPEVIGDVRDRDPGRRKWP